MYERMFIAAFVYVSFWKCVCVYVSVCSLSVCVCCLAVSLHFTVSSLVCVSVYLILSVYE